MSNTTHKATLPSGIEIEVRPFKGEDKSELSKGKSGVEKLLQNCIIRIGSQTLITEKFLKKMLYHDRNYAIFLIRQVSFNFPTEFEFEHMFTFNNGGKIRKFKEDFLIDLSEQNFGLKPYHFYADWLKKERYDFADPEERFPAFDSYDDIEQYLTFETVLPDSKKKIRLNLLNGELSAKFASVKEPDVDFKVKMRNPCEWMQKDENAEGKFYPIHIQSFTALDIAHMAGEIAKREGDFDIILKLEYENDDFGKKVDIVSIFSKETFLSPERVST